jgi:hypothetical protein
MDKTVQAWIYFRTPTILPTINGGAFETSGINLCYMEGFKGETLLRIISQSYEGKIIII